MVGGEGEGGLAAGTAGAAALLKTGNQNALLHLHGYFNLQMSVEYGT